MEKHTSLVVEGMTLDSHPSLQPPNSYREARNGTLISKGGNNYSFESIEGTVLNWSMPEHKTGASKFVPIGWFRLGDRLLVHSTDSISANGGDGEIGIVTFDNAGVGVYEAVYYHSELLYSQSYMIFGYGLEENDQYHRSYWTDNFNQPRTINTRSSVLTTAYATGSLVVTDQYMVLTNSIGSITHNGIVYGPKQTAGNIFTAVNANFTSSGSVKVIKLLDPNVLNYTPERMMGSIDFLKYTLSGALYCGVKLYAYQLATSDGYETSWSYTLNPIHVGPSTPGAVYQSYVGGGQAALQNSGKGIQLTISDIPSGFSEIKVAVIEIDESKDVIRNIEIFFLGDVTGTSMTITHNGQEALLPITLEDLGLSAAVIMRAKDIATIKQRQVLVNLSERQELDWTPSVGATLSPFLYTIPTDYNGLISGVLAFATLMCPASGVVSGNIVFGGHYVVRDTAGTPGTITYNAVVYNVGDTFVGDAGVTTFISTDGAIVKGCIRIKSYDKFAGGSVYKVIDLEDEFFDYKSMASHCYLKGFWREETYRIGALAWDKFGNPYAIRWLDDITIPAQSDGYHLMTSSGTNYALNVMGITVDGIDITDIKDNISAISIVRVLRDPQILAQGLIMQMVEKDGETNVSIPISTCVPAYDHNGALGPGGAGAATLGFNWTILGPEFDFILSAFDIVLQSGDKLSPAADYSPLLGGGGEFMARVNSDQQVYSKYYTPNDWAGSDHGIELVETVTAGGVFAYNSGGVAYTFKNHDIGTAGSHPDPLGFTGAGGMQQKTAAGGKRTLIVTNTADFTNTAPGGTGTGVGGTGINSARKLLTNYVRPKGSLYGGNSEAAKANNKYIFCGHYQKIDATVLADIVDGSGNYILNGMQVFGGDCFVHLYDRVSSQYDEGYAAPGAGGYLDDGSYSWGVIFPLESNVNSLLREARHMCKDGMHVDSNGVYYNLAGVRQDEDYRYQPSYSSENSQIQYDALPVGFYSVLRFPYMARYSEAKVLGETIDNMRRFLLNNFKNADAIYGEINNAAVGIDRLFYWQNRGIGYFPIEERETTVGALGQAVQLGVGGVMQRADAMDNFYGNQHQSSLIKGENFFQWFDMRRFSIMRMTFSGGVVDVTVVKGLQTFFQNVFAVAEPDAFNILNMDKPILGQGVIGVYDPIKKTAYHTFKFNSTEYGPDGDLLKNRDFTIGISSVLGKFVGFFDFAPVIYIEHDSRVYGVKKTRQAIVGSTNYNIYNEVSQSGSSYVCIQAYTSASSPVAPASDTTHWVKTGEEDQVHRFFIGDIGKFFGVVYPWNITFVVNPSIDSSKTFDSAEVYGDSNPFTDVFCSTEELSASDTDIAATNKNYKFYDGKWNFNYPLSGKQRLTDQYLLVKFQAKNYLADITSSLNLKKRIVYLKTKFRIRK